MNQDLNRKEWLSALVDGEVQGQDFGQALAQAHDAQGRECWQLYHLIGDVLRSPELAHHSQHDLLSGLRTRLAQEPLPPLAPALQQVAPAPAAGAGAARDAANDSASWRWKMVAGFASVAAVAAVGWNLAGLPAGQGASLAAAPPLLPAATLVARQEMPAVALSVRQPGGEAGDATVMLRDPRLDELLAAHQRFGSKAALQMPAEFLRNASFEHSAPALRP